jgi:hypothetical protein
MPGLVFFATYALLVYSGRYFTIRLLCAWLIYIMVEAYTKLRIIVVSYKRCFSRRFVKSNFEDDTVVKKKKKRGKKNKSPLLDF